MSVVWEEKKKKLITTCPSGDSISKLVKKVRTHGILFDRKPLKEIVF
jgi:hypothetical protein